MSLATRGAMRTGLLFFVGALLLESAWIWTLPPFRGTDEFDHAYRAAAVAHGEWKPVGVATPNGRGGLVTVPESIVRAAHPVCASLEYTGPGNCSPVEKLGGGRVLVGSGASAYNPLFYWVVGTAARPFQGSAALYAMRVCAGLLCALLVAGAAGLARLWTRTGWPLVGLVVAITPVVAFSTAVAAPNGLEICAGLGLWTALLGLATPEGRRRTRPLLIGAAVNAAVLTTLRSIGPLWVILVFLTAMLIVGLRTLWGVVRENATVAATCVLTVTAATLVSVGWTRASGAARLAPDPQYIHTSHVVIQSLSQLPLWVLQGIAAFPRRAIPAPPVVYFLVALVFVVTIALGYRSAPRRVRLALLATALVSFLVPVFLTALTFRAVGPIWQGRYGAPYHVGLTMLAVLALDRAGKRMPMRYVGLGWSALVLANVVSIVHVLHTEQRTSPVAGSSAWVAVPVWSVALLVGVGLALWLAAAGPSGVAPSGRTGLDAGSPSRGSAARSRPRVGSRTPANSSCRGAE